MKMAKENSSTEKKYSNTITEEMKALPIRVIIGLGNPGHQYYYNRHNIGFRIVDELAKKHGGIWESKKNMEAAEIIIHGKKILLVKPETFMNDSGKVVPMLKKQGIKAENILVIHDELEKPCNKLAFKIGGSHRGHNGLRSLIAACGPDFARLRFGIGRPESKNDVSDYVLQNFSQNLQEIEHGIGQAIMLLEQLFEE